MGREYGRKIGVGHKITHPLPLALLTRLLDWAIECDDGYESACWAWQGHCDDDGYAEVKWRGKKFRAGRLAYAAFVGEVPSGMDVDHQCRNRACINPKHLQVIDLVENRVHLRKSRLEECPI